MVSFLKDRTMRVRIRESESGERGLENRVPQGSVLSVTLFALKINGIVEEIPADSSFFISLYVERPPDWLLRFRFECDTRKDAKLPE